MQLPTLRQLEYFAGIVDHGSFRAAAEACFVTQPALSSQIQQLERTLGVRLFERDGRKVRLSLAGTRLLPRARLTLESASNLVAEAQAQGEPLAGPLRLGVIPTVAPYLLPGLAPEAHRRYPELRLLLHEGQTQDLVEQLNDHQLDLLLLALDVELDGAEEHFLFDDPFVLAVPDGHPLAKRKTVSRSDLDGLDLLLLEDGHCLREHAFAACSIEPSQEVDDFRATSMNTLVHMVASGIGATLLPQMAVQDEADGFRGITLIPFDEPQPSRRIGLVWRHSSPRKEEFRLMAELLMRVFRPRSKANEARLGSDY
jgi:LysR family hydrogen peroxide-inducible transcriptional activator